MIVAALAAAAVTGAWSIQGPAPAAYAQTGTTYYVDATGGDDDATGLDEASAWQSLDGVNQTTFESGDRILLAQFGFGDSVIRNNVISGNTQYQVYLHSNRSAHSAIYNNTIYNDRSDYLIHGYGQFPGVELRHHQQRDLLDPGRCGPFHRPDRGVPQQPVRRRRPAGPER